MPKSFGDKLHLGAEDVLGAEKRRYRRLDTDLEARVKNLSDPSADPIDVRIINLGPEPNSSFR